MFCLNDPDEMTPEVRLQELAGILAVGYLRLQKQTPGLTNIIPGDQQHAGNHIPISE